MLTRSAFRQILLALVVFGAGPASAQVVRTFVSTTGSDTNLCTRTSPCRNFDAAITAVSAGGEVVPLDSGGYGPVTITKSVSVISPAGIHASITPTSGNAINVDIASPTAVVVLHGLSLSGAGGDLGIVHSGQGRLYVERCTVHGFDAYGIRGQSGSSVYLSVKDTAVRSCGAAGILVLSSPGVTTLVEHCRLEGNNNEGMYLLSNSRVTVRDTVAASNTYGFRIRSEGGGSELNVENCIAVNNTAAGFHAEGFVGYPAEMNLERCRSSMNTEGVVATGPAVIRVSDCSITANGSGVTVGAGATILSRSNNTVEGNILGNTFLSFFSAQ